jgi:hypothetical protein
MPPPPPTDLKACKGENELKNSKKSLNSLKTEGAVYALKSFFIMPSFGGKLFLGKVARRAIK